MNLNKLFRIGTGCGIEIRTGLDENRYEFDWSKARHDVKWRSLRAVSLVNTVGVF